MRIGRTLPPAAAPLIIENLLNGFKALSRRQAEIKEFKSDIKNYFQVKHCFLASSGKAALTHILQALYRISPDRDEVLIPAFTCYSVPSAIVRAGLKIRLCDINPATLDFDFEKLQRNLQSKNKLLTIVCQHLFGLPANIPEINGIIDDPQIPVIEDAAQAMGNIADSRHLGTLGDIGFFSLGRGKAFSTVEGGIIVTNSDKIAESLGHSIQKFRVPSVAATSKLIAYALALSVLTQPSLFWIPKLIPGLKLGETIYNPQFPMKQFSQFQAGLARTWRKRISLFQNARKNNVLYWEKALGRFSWIQPINIKKESLEKTFPLLRFPVLIKNASLRNALLETSAKCGLGIMPSYPTPIDEIEEIKDQLKGAIYPGANDCAKQLVTFPVHGFVTSADLLRIVSNLEKLQAMYSN